MKRAHINVHIGGLSASFSLRPGVVAEPLLTLITHDAEPSTARDGPLDRQPAVVDEVAPFAHADADVVAVDE